MHHNNNKHSTSNHTNPQHHKPQYPSAPAPEKIKGGFLGKLKERFKEKPVTEEEVYQLGLKAKKETYKTQIRRAKVSRPSRFGFGGSAPAPSYRRSSQYQEDNSWLLGNQRSGRDSSWDPSFSMFTDTEKRSKKNQRSGLEDLF